ncbi:MAG: PKD domain-containing protein, partial [Candidatus Thermoplasmatota archaeon]|nr:PKD domain-containing protein [Candidatus Thermoplasmatota archaeon]
GSESNDNIIKNNNISANLRFGLNLDRGSLRNRVSYNLATSNTQGVALLLMPGCKDNIFDNNTGMKNFQGIYVWGGIRNVIENNSMYTSVNFGLILYIDATQNLVKQNNLSMHPSGGLLIFDASSNQVWNNTCLSNGVGIQLWDDSDNNIITENLMINNTISGIMILAAACQNNLLYHNTLIKNNGTGGIQGHDWGQNNVWDDGNGRGNFWSDYLNQRYNASQDGNVWNMSYEMGGKGVGKDRFSLAALPDPSLDTEKPIFMDDNTTLKATTGDMFNFSINLSDDIGFKKVKGFYTYSDNEKLNLAPMKYFGEDNWYRNVLMREDATGFSYYFEIEDYLGNNITIGKKDVMIIDNDPPELRNDITHNVATTGDSFTFSANITDNMGVDFVNVTYTYDDRIEYNISMTWSVENTWSRTITVEEGVENLDYYFFYGDISNNTNNSEFETVIVRDNDLPFLENDNTGSFPTTGDAFTFVGNFSDNIEILEVYVNYSINGVEFLPRSLVNEEDQRWSITMIIPSNGTNLSYYFHFSDNDGNPVTTSETSLAIVDNDNPVFMTDGTSDQPATGDELQFQTFVTDNIGISIVKVIYTYGVSGIMNESMSNEGRGSPDMFSKTVTVDPEAILVDYHFFMMDDSGNSNFTETIVLFVSDNDPPTADAGEDIWIDQHTKVTFNGTQCQDNIGLDEYEWSFEYDGQKTYLYGDDAKFTFITAGTYEVTLNITDTSGNWQNDTMIVTVNDTTDPTARAGDDHSGIIGKLVKFDASASTDNVGIVEYDWGLIYNNSQLNYTTKILNFTFLIPGTYEILLVVKDARGNWGTDTVIVAIIDETPPGADAGPDQIVAKGTTVRFNGTGSTDNTGITNYTWSFSYNGTKRELYGVSPEFRFDIPDTYSIKLTVEDGSGNSKSDTMKLTVEKGADGDDTEGPDDDTDPTQTNEDTQGIDFNWILIIAGIIVLLVVVFIIVLLIIKKRKRPDDDDIEKPLSDEGQIDIPDGTETVSAPEPVTEAPAVSSLPLTDESSPVTAEGPICTSCGQPSQYYAEYNCHWCLGCQAYVYTEESSGTEAEESPLDDQLQIAPTEAPEELPVSSMDGEKEPAKALPEAQLDKVNELDLDERAKSEKAEEVSDTQEELEGTGNTENVQDPVEKSGNEETEKNIGAEQSSAALDKSGQPTNGGTQGTEKVTSGSDIGDGGSQENEPAHKDVSVDEGKDSQIPDSDISQEETSNKVEEKTDKEVPASDTPTVDGSDSKNGEKGEQEELDSMLDDLLVGL